MRSIFITGVSRGLGQALAAALADNDTRIIGLGRSKGDFAGEFHSCDFTKPQLAASILGEALSSEDLENASSIAFIANAGTLGPLAKAQNLDPFDIERAIAANLGGSAISAVSFLKRVENIDRPKLFAQISSGAALPDRAKASWSLYCSCKAGQEQLVRTIAAEQTGAPFPTKFVNINPGVMETAMQEQIRATSPETFPEVARFIKLKEEGRIPSPDTVANKIATLLASHETLENGKTYDLST